VYFYFSPAYHLVLTWGNLRRGAICVCVSVAHTLYLAFSFILVLALLPPLGT